VVEELSQMELHDPSGVFSKLLREQEYSIKSKQRIAILIKAGVHQLQQPSALTDAQEKHREVIVMGNYRDIYCSSPPPESSWVNSSSPTVSTSHHPSPQRI